MSDLLTPGAAILFMKVGTHAREPLDVIIERKSREIEEEGYALWGYGGNTCHPETMVQPFARTYEKQGQTVHLLMEPMNSSHFAERLRADEFSPDGLEWMEIPHRINVIGSRYTLAIKDLRKEELELPLDQTVVAIGNCEGRPGNLYVKGRVDKACLQVVENTVLTNEERRPARIGLVADLVKPYAVYLRNKPS